MGFCDILNDLGIVQKEKNILLRQAEKKEGGARDNLEIDVEVASANNGVVGKEYNMIVEEAYFGFGILKFCPKVVEESRVNVQNMKQTVNPNA